jgi:hypothetical protein
VFVAQNILQQMFERSDPFVAVVFASFAIFTVANGRAYACRIFFIGFHDKILTDNKKELKSTESHEIS